MKRLILILMLIGSAPYAYAEETDCTDVNGNPFTNTAPLHNSTRDMQPLYDGEGGPNWTQKDYELLLAGEDSYYSDSVCAFAMTYSIVEGTQEGTPDENTCIKAAAGTEGNYYYVYNSIFEHTIWEHRYLCEQNWDTQCQEVKWLACRIAARTARRLRNNLPF